ncbi:MAG: hypothetical protein WC889_02905 [Myxococcota bacterium]|jgi:hypothetical protein
MNMTSIRRGPQKLSLTDIGEAAPVIIVEPMRFIPMSRIPSFRTLVSRGVISR